jgi:hypothetical protein
MICYVCSEDKKITEFESGRKQCKKCKNINSYKKKKENGYYELIKNRQKIRRQDIKYRCLIILKDSKSYDSTNFLENDLTVEFIEKIIDNGCSYCGTNKMKIGLDRIDNNIGHLMSNVVSACTRCNFIRGTMPYKAWIVLVPSIKYAYDNNLFGNWIPGCHKNKSGMIK